MSDIKPYTWYPFGNMGEIEFGRIDPFPNKVKIIYFWLVVFRLQKEGNLEILFTGDK